MHRRFKGQCRRREALLWVGGRGQKACAHGKISLFLNNEPVFNDFGAFLCIFQPYLQQLLQSLKPDCYHCLRIHSFVWKKCATVDKRHIAPQGDPVACGHWKIFMCTLDILCIFQPQFSTYFAVNNLIGVNGKGTCSGEICL